MAARTVSPIASLPTCPESSKMWSRARSAIGDAHSVPQVVGSPHTVVPAEGLSRAGAPPTGIAAGHVCRRFSMEL